MSGDDDAGVCFEGWWPGIQFEAQFDAVVDLVPEEKQQLSEQTRRSQDKDKEIARLLAENALLRREPEGTRRRRRPEEVTTSAPEGSSLTPQPPRQDPTSPVFSPRQDSPGTATAGQERAQTSRAHSAPKPAQVEGEAQPKTAREARDSTEAAELQLNSLVKA